MKDILKTLLRVLQGLIEKLESMKVVYLLAVTVCGFIALLCKLATFSQWALEFQIPLVTLYFAVNQTQKYIQGKQDKNDS